MKIKLSLLIFLMVFKIGFALSFSVFPTDFKVDASKISTQEASIVNNTAEPLRVEIYSEVDSEYGEKYNLNENIKIFPKTVSIKPGGTQKIRFRVKPDLRIKDGVNKSYLTFKEIPYEIKSTNKNAKSEEIKTELKMITVLSVPIYSLGKNIVSNVEIKNVLLKSNGSILTIYCDSIVSGNAPTYLMYEVSIINDNYKSTGGLGNTARDGKKTLSISFEGKNNLKGKNARVKISDTREKVYYNNILKVN